ncbi:hypothetical protein CCACVL1_10365 [Corchorus capsularis]|uniref:Uncharacterized protein n=1 Tax=Corchorus capsularis TaxID=210143 RepID=A0A1R3IRI4_COCAP|nr:hypothetical protein CCACVL1_10365 [Corchorus capsularis]
MTNALGFSLTILDPEHALLLIIEAFSFPALLAKLLRSVNKDYPK